MKKIIATLLLLVMSLAAFASCGSKSDIRVGYMSGPTGMGMAKLIHDNGGKDGNDKYTFQSYTNSRKALDDLTANNVDIICLPTNDAADYLSVNDDIVVLAVNCLNSLYLLSDKNSDVTSLAELDGKTVYTCKNGTPKLILDYIISELGLNITVSTSTPDGTKEIVTPDDLQNQVVTVGNLPYVVMPEPKVTATLAAINNANKPEISYSVDVDLADEWEKISDTPVTMGCIATTGEYISKNKRAVRSFLEEYEDSVEFIGDDENRETAAKYVAETGIMAKEPLALTALKNLDDAIDYLDGDDMKRALKAFYNAIGIEQPDDEFYYND